MIRLATLIKLNFINSSCANSNLLIWVVRAYPLIEIRQIVPCRAIRGDSISVNSTLPPLTFTRGPSDRASTLPDRPTGDFCGTFAENRGDLQRLVFSHVKRPTSTAAEILRRRRIRTKNIIPWPVRVMIIITIIVISIISIIISSSSSSSCCCYSYFLDRPCPTGRLAGQASHPAAGTPRNNHDDDDDDDDNDNSNSNM